MSTLIKTAAVLVHHVGIARVENSVALALAFAFRTIERRTVGSGTRSIGLHGSLSLSLHASGALMLHTSILAAVFNNNFKFFENKIKILGIGCC